MSDPNRLAARIAALSPEQRADLQQRLKTRRQGDTESIKPRSQDGAPIPLSFAQERLWFVDQLEPGNVAYNLLAQYQIPSPVDQVALQRVLDEIVQRHETLRTTFPVIDGKPAQAVSSRLSVQIQVVDLRKQSEAAASDEYNRLITSEARRPFDLTAAPLLRATLYRRPGKFDALALVMHHIVSDGWSLKVLFQELAGAYETAAGGRRPALPDLPIQYADFAVWQRRRLEGERLEKMLSYWKNRLDGIAPVFPLTTDRPRPARWSYRGATQVFTIPASLADPLRSLSQQHRATVFMTLLAIFKILLARYTGQPDIMVGSSIANRNRAETENLIGFFVNTIVLRTQVEPALHFGEILDRVRETTLGAYAHQDLPFEVLVARLQPERAMSHNPLVQVMVDYQTSAATDASPSGPDEEGAKPPDIIQSAAKFDLSLFLDDDGQRIRAALEYNTDLFDHDTVGRWIAHFRQLLREVLRDPGRPVGRMPLMDPEERRRILVEWNRTEATASSEGCFHQRFEAQARETPDLPALVAGPLQVSYAELNRRANRLARRLRDLGAGPEVRVGVSMCRSPDAVVTLLAVMKAGGAYVPLDPSYPLELLEFIIKDAAIQIVVTDDSRNTERSRPGERRVDWARFEEQAARYSDENLSIDLSADNLAYVIYTSGSTGLPKGVMIEHRSVCNAAAAMVTRFGIRPGSRSLQFYSFNFDGSLFECFMTLHAGATLCFAPEEASKPGPELMRFLREQAIHTAIFPPSALAALPDEPLPELTTLIVGGEACTADIVDRWARGRAFFNAYGPSEGTIAVTAVQCLPGRGSPSIGRPMANTRIYILDDRMGPVPIGVPGEICIGGPNVARGYIGRETLNRERFVPLRLEGIPADRIYRTGDRGRYLPDGNIKFLGRIDAQVKIRGYRVEPEGVNAVLLAHPDVSDAAVVTREEIPGDKRLVAYASPRPGCELTAEALRAWLRKSLPEYTLPSAFVIIASLPRSSAGKVIREKLPAPETRTAEIEARYVAPRSDLEQSLAAVWGEILGLKRVGADDNFFDLGGHSLLATQVVSRVREQFHIEFPLHALFQGPTVAEMAAVVERLRAAEKTGIGDTILPLQEGGSPVDRLADDEVGALLERMLSLKGNQE
jgi:amino acid adenylation domain-containing protein